MRREYRLRRSADFERARTTGRGCTHPLLVCYIYPRQDDSPTRVGITVGKRNGKAVVRNRIRRRVREAVRGLHPSLAAGYDLMLIARAPAAEANLKDLTAALRWLFQRAGVCKDEERVPLP